MSEISPSGAFSPKLVIPIWRNRIIVAVAGAAILVVTAPSLTKIGQDKANLFFGAPIVVAMSAAVWRAVRGISVEVDRDRVVVRQLFRTSRVAFNDIEEAGGQRRLVVLVPRLCLYVRLRDGTEQYFEEINQGVRPPDEGGPVWRAVEAINERARTGK